jgi:tetratricopeptide (TPR) repeat protein
VGVQENFSGHGRVVITASDALEYAFEDNDLTSSTPHPALFTDAVVRGLRSGEADLDQDGAVSVDDLYSYVYREVRQRTPHQTPTMTSTIRGGLYIAANPLRATTPITGTGDPFKQRTSESGWQREEAALGLRRLTESADEAMAVAATKALEQLAADQDRLVRASAMAALGDVAQSHYERALVLHGQGDIAGATVELQEVLKSGHMGLAPLAAFNLGLINARAGRADEAERYYKLAIDSDHPRAAASAALNLGSMLETHGKTELAAEAYEKALTFDESYAKPRAAFLLGQLREEQGNYRGAWRAYGIARADENHPFVVETEMKYATLIQYVTSTDLLTDLLRSAGYSDAEAQQLIGSTLSPR